MMGPEPQCIPASWASSPPARPLENRSSEGYLRTTERIHVRSAGRGEGQGLTRKTESTDGRLRSAGPDRATAEGHAMPKQEQGPEVADANMDGESDRPSAPPLPILTQVTMKYNFVGGDENISYVKDHFIPPTELDTTQFFNTPTQHFNVPISDPDILHNLEHYAGHSGELLGGPLRATELPAEAYRNKAHASQDAPRQCALAVKEEAIASGQEARTCKTASHPQPRTALFTGGRRLEGKARNYIEGSL